MKGNAYFIVEFLIEQILLKGQGSHPSTTQVQHVEFADFVEFAYFFSELGI